MEQSSINTEKREDLFSLSSRVWTTPTRAPALTSGINQSGEIRPSIWLNGAIVGRWELGHSTDSITVSYDLYPQLSSKIRTQIQEQHHRLETFVNTTLLPISRKTK